MIFIRFTDVPKQPQDVNVVDVEKNSATVTWSAPTSDGGSPIAGYYIEKLNYGRWTKVNKQPITKCIYKMTNLIEDDNYELRIVAENEAGLSHPSESIRFMPKDPFNKPGQPSQPIIDEITQGEVLLSWQPPTQDGGAPIIKYTLEMKTKGDARWKSVSTDIEETSHRISGLEEKTVYEFRVAAENKVGKGAFSDASAPVKYGMLFTFCHRK